MNNILFLFEKDQADIKDSNRLKTSMSKLGYKYLEIPRISYYSENFDIPKNIDHLFFFGSLPLTKKIKQYAEKYNKLPGAWLSLGNYECSKYYPEYKNYLLNYNGKFAEVGEILRDLTEDETTYSHYFIRPDAGDKPFAGGVFNNLNLIKMLNHNLEMGNIKHNTMCVINDTINIAAEYRMFIVDGKVISGSQYKINNEIKYAPVPIYIYDYCRTILNTTTFRPDVGFVMDIAQLNTNRLCLLEINSLSCSGIYGAETDSIILQIGNYFEHVDYRPFA